MDAQCIARVREKVVDCVLLVAILLVPSACTITKEEEARMAEDDRIVAQRQGDEEKARHQDYLKAIGVKPGDSPQKIARLVVKADRRYYAEEMEKIYLSNNIDMKVRVVEGNSLALRFESVLMNRSFVNQTINELSEGSLKKLSDLGFKRLIFTDGYDRTWTHKLE
jgi:hypothetical protein